MLSTAVQHAVGGTALGAPWLVSKGAAGCEPALDHVLALAEPAGPSRLPLRLPVTLGHTIVTRLRTAACFLEKNDMMSCVMT